MGLLNWALSTDSYKASHWVQYPPYTRHVYSYFESRGVPSNWSDEVVFFGLQYYLKKYLEGAVVTEADVHRAERFWTKHFGREGLFNTEGWLHIVHNHEGRLPVRIKAAPEGLVLPSSNVLMTVENTDPKCFWLTNWLETVLTHIWYPCTVASQSRQMKKLILKHLEKNGDPAGLPFKLHDFGFRGATCPEQAGIGGAAHLINFDGTDTVAGSLMADEYYDADSPGMSIPASEHSTITAWGPEGELDAFRNMLEQYPTGLVACVSDSFDIGRACSVYWGQELREAVLAREGTLVVRPDSGHPPDSVLDVLERLGKAFGIHSNGKGYKVLPPQVRVIQGDGIDYPMLREILERMETHGWSADNLAFGSGGGLLQKVNRDTCKFAFKCSEVQIHGTGPREVYKSPVGDKGKRSKRGRLKLAHMDGTYKTVPEYRAGDDHLVEVFCDGEIKQTWTFNQVMERASL